MPRQRRTPLPLPLVVVGRGRPSAPPPLLQTLVPPAAVPPLRFDRSCVNTHTPRHHCCRVHWVAPVRLGAHDTFALIVGPQSIQSTACLHPLVSEQRWAGGGRRCRCIEQGERWRAGKNGVCVGGGGARTWLLRAGPRMWDLGRLPHRCGDNPVWRHCIRWSRSGASSGSPARVALPAEAVRGDPGTSCATQPCHVMIMLCSKSPVLVITDTKSSMEM